MIAYDRFLRLRRELWDDFERRLDLARTRPTALGYSGLETLALQYRSILHDHALASARFAGTAATRRLQSLALQGTHWLLLDSQGSQLGLGRFFRSAFPGAIARQRLNLGIALSLFVTTALLGFFLALVQPGLGAAFLGPAALEGLKRGELWTRSIFSVVPASVTASFIATNNMSVAITAWAGGVLLGLGALYIVLFNGFMLGALIGVTSHYDLAGQLLEFVAAHGPLELTLIIVSAGAGLGMGRSIVEATDRPRRDVMADAGRDGVLILLGCLPWFALLAVVESFISPQALIPASLKLVLGQMLLALFLGLAFGRIPKKESS
jgi:uncharacterized membrane protein SpoIIM required for sporulation